MLVLINLFNIFSIAGSVLKTDGNENNFIGLPKTIFKLAPTDNFAIYELGSNHPGEIAYLADICKPEMAAITNVGISHLQYFKDEKEIFKEKTSIFKNNPNVKIFPGDDARFSEFTGIRFGFSDKCDYRITNLKVIDDVTYFRVNDEKYELQTGYKKIVLNATIAIALAKECGLPKKIIDKAFEKPFDLNLRMQIIRKNERVFLADCYNANPVSMRAALSAWRRLLWSKRRGMRHLSLSCRPACGRRKFSIPPRRRRLLC